MKTNEEREFEERQRSNEDFYEILKKLDRLNLLLVLLHVHKLLLFNKIREIPKRWIEAQVNLDKDIKNEGMPMQIRKTLAKWFNYPLFRDFIKFKFLKNIYWKSFFNEEDTYELQIYRHYDLAGYVCLEPKQNREASIIGIFVKEKYRNTGLGTAIFQESIRLSEGRFSKISGILEREFYPELESSLHWLRKQGFEIQTTENDDYKVELRLMA